MGSAAENPLASAQLRRCHNCAAPARGEVSWCLQCYAPIERGGGGAVPPAATIERDLTPDQPSALADDHDPRPPGRHASGAPPLDPAQARELADRMISQFTAAPIPAKNWVDRVTASKSAGIFWAALGLGIVAATCLVVGTVIGLVTD